MLIEPDEARGIGRGEDTRRNEPNARIVLSVSFAGSPQEQAGASEANGVPEAQQRSPLRFPVSRVELCTAARR